MLIPNQVEQKNAQGSTNPRLNLEYGGLGGLYPRLAGVDDSGKIFEQWVSSTPHTDRDLIPVVLRLPMIFDALADEELGKHLAKQYIEILTTLPESIEGLKRTLTSEQVEQKIHGTNESIEVFSDVRYEKCEITKNYIEKYGKPINSIIEFILKFGVMGSEEKVGLALTLDLKEDYRKRSYLLSLPTFASATMLYFSPDPQMGNVDEAYLSTNVIPKTAGTIESKLNKNEAKTLTEYSIPFTSFTRHDATVRAYAQLWLNEINKTRATFESQPLFVNKQESAVIADLSGGAAPGTAIPDSEIKEVNPNTVFGA